MVRFLIEEQHFYCRVGTRWHVTNILLFLKSVLATKTGQLSRDVMADRSGHQWDSILKTEKRILRIDIKWKWWLRLSANFWKWCKWLKLVLLWLKGDGNSEPRNHIKSKSIRTNVFSLWKFLYPINFWETKYDKRATVSLENEKSQSSILLILV